MYVYRVCMYLSTQHVSVHTESVSANDSLLSMNSSCMYNHRKKEQILGGLQYSVTYRVCDPLCMYIYTKSMCTSTNTAPLPFLVGKKNLPPPFVVCYIVLVGQEHVLNTAHGANLLFQRPEIARAVDKYVAAVSDHQVGGGAVARAAVVPVVVDGDIGPRHFWNWVGERLDDVLHQRLGCYLLCGECTHTRTHTHQNTRTHARAHTHTHTCIYI